MTNTTRVDQVGIGSHIQTSDGNVHVVRHVDIRRTPKRRIVRRAVADTDLGRVDLTQEDSWRLVQPAPYVRHVGGASSPDGLYHSHACPSTRSRRYQLGSTSHRCCLRCGFEVVAPSPAEADDAYTSDWIGPFVPPTREVEIPRTFEVGTRVTNARGAWVRLRCFSHASGLYPVWAFDHWAPSFAEDVTVAESVTNRSREVVERQMRSWLRNR